MEHTFNAWEVSRYGGPEVLSPVTLAVPRPGPNEVLIRVYASAVTRADGMMRAGEPRFARVLLGWSRPRAGLSGTGLSGEVVAAGRDVTRFAPGDAVFGEAGMKFGANADYICLDATGTLMRKPETLSHEEAAGLCDGPLTSWHFLTSVGQVQKGERVLILGGSGSLGSAAVQIAKALGAEVTATASARNADLLRHLGADHVLDYTAEDPLAHSGAYNVIFDTLGVARYQQARPALVEGGRYLCPVLGLGLLRDMALSRLFGTRRALFSAAGLQSPANLRAHLKRVLELVADGRFTPVMDRTYPLADLIEAHRYVATGRKRGNVVVV